MHFFAPAQRTLAPRASGRVAVSSPSTTMRKHFFLLRKLTPFARANCVHDGCYAKLSSRRAHAAVSRGEAGLTSAEAYIPSTEQPIPSVSGQNDVQKQQIGNHAHSSMFASAGAAAALAYFSSEAAALAADGVAYNNEMSSEFLKDVAGVL